MAPKDLKTWERTNEEYLAAIAGDRELSDEGFVASLEDLIDRAEAMIKAKREEMARADQGTLALDEPTPEEKVEMAQKAMNELSQNDEDETS